MNGVRLLLLGLLACSPSKPTTDRARATGGSSLTNSVRLDAATAASIGAATMTPDGTIRLQLRADGPDGAQGDALLLYPRSDPEYAKVLAHLGGLEPGESKPVPPWPDPPDAGAP